MKLFFKLLNPFVIILLNSPLHFILSSKIIVLYFHGRNTGRFYKTPVSYLMKKEEILCMTSRKNIWWKNFLENDDINICLLGNKVKAKVVVELDDKRIEQALLEIITHSPADGFFAGVKVNKGKPSTDDIKKVAPEHVLLQLSL